MQIGCYTRYSSSEQRAASHDDQLRNCKPVSARIWPGCTLVHYKDSEISGYSKDRPDFNRMKDDLINGKLQGAIVDDLSRLSRDSIQTTQFIRHIKFLGLRFVGATDGFDSDREGYKIDMGFRGMLNEMQLDDLAHKTHRGLKGQALLSKSAGGRSFGYTSEPVDDGFIKVIDTEQAEVVRWVFKKYLSGWSPRAIAAELNKREIPTARGGRWSVTSIYGDTKRGIGMLINPLYSGVYIWNRSKWVKDPTTNRRRRIERPRSEWVVQDCPQLKIIDDATWQAAQQRVADTKIASQGQRGKHGAGPKYLFSGLLKCGTCGGNFHIIAQHRYGCGRCKNSGRSVCTNSITVSRLVVEDKLLTGIRQQLAQPGCYAEFERAVRAEIKVMQCSTAGLERQKRLAVKERDNIMAAIRAGVVTPTTKAELTKAEHKVDNIDQQLQAATAINTTTIIPRLRDRYNQMISSLGDLQNISEAREQIKQLLGPVVLHPENGQLVAELMSSESKVLMVAGARYGINLTPLRIPLSQA